MNLLRFPFSLSVVLDVRDTDSPALPRVLEGLKAQTLPRRHWHLIVLDRRSHPSAELPDLLAWHPKVTVLRHDGDAALPLSVRTVLACRTDLVAVLDGRTVLEADYLCCAMRLAGEHPFAGLFGGRVDAQLVATKPRWQRPFFKLFGINEVPQDRSCARADRRHMPSAGAYLVRREHLRRVAHILLHHPFFQEPAFRAQRDAFDYRAATARTVVQAGASIALFAELRASRVLFRSDLRERAIQREVCRDAFSRVVERFVWTGILPDLETPSRWERLSLRWLRFWQFGRLARLRAAHRAGVVQALDLTAAHRVSATPTPTRAPASSAKPQGFAPSAH